MGFVVESLHNGEIPSLFQGLLGKALTVNRLKYFSKEKKNGMAPEKCPPGPNTGSCSAHSLKAFRCASPSRHRTSV